MRNSQFLKTASIAVSLFLLVGGAVCCLILLRPAAVNDSANTAVTKVVEQPPAALDSALSHPTPSSGAVADLTPTKRTPLINESTVASMANVHVWLRQYREATPYDKHGIPEDLGVLQTFLVLFQENPELYIELMLEEFDDNYLWQAFDASITPANVSVLTSFIQDDSDYFADLGARHGLHIQNPTLYLEFYERRKNSTDAMLLSNFLSAIAELAYWQVRADFIEQFVHSTHPQQYRIALEKQGQEDMFELAQQMWQQHVKDDYPEYTPGMGRGGGRLERITIALDYGIEDAWDEAYQLLQSGFLIREPFMALGLTDPALEFPDVRSRLRYEAQTRRWFVADR